jgi:predicted transcriptional regulator
MAKGQRGAKKKSKPSDAEAGEMTKLKPESDTNHCSTLQLSDSELNILAVFRKYLMTPGQMLCLSNTDIGSMKKSLDRLTAAGLLIAEDFKGSYSLTRSGFEAMNELK